MIKSLPDIKIVVIRMDKVPYMDQSGLFTLEDAIKDMQAQNVKVLFTDLHGQPEDLFDTYNIKPGLVAEENFFEDFDSCMKWVGDYLRKTA